jgi:hypothetical protein
VQLERQGRLVKAKGKVQKAKGKNENEIEAI